MTVVWFPVDEIPVFWLSERKFPEMVPEDPLDTMPSPFSFAWFPVIFTPDPVERIPYSVIWIAEFPEIVASLPVEFTPRELFETVFPEMTAEEPDELIPSVLFSTMLFLITAEEPFVRIPERVLDSTIFPVILASSLSDTIPISFQVTVLF